MELEAEDGAVVFIPKGCKKELGRGPGIAAQDLTVSRRQILLEVQEPNLKVGSVDNDSLSSRLHVEVLGPNPVCILHSRQQNPNSMGRQHGPEGMILLRKGDVDLLSPGDKLSLSVKRPLFFTVRKGGRRIKDVMSGFIERSGSTVGESGKEEISSKVEIGNQATENDLLASWKARKKGKGIGQQDNEPIQIAKDEGTSHLVKDKEVSTKEEEVGIAEAVARRQKRAHERTQQHQHKQQVELNKNSRGVAGTSSFVNDKICEGQELEHCLVDTKGIDPVKEFGFLVEGSEFEQYGKRCRRNGGKWDWSFPKDHSDQDEEQGGKKVTKGHHSTSSGRKKTKKDEDDDEWMGEDEEEKLASASVKKSKLITKSCLRSHGSSSSPSKKTPAGVRRNYSSNTDTEQSQEDEEDATLGGFIVDDDEEEEENLDEEEESSDDDEIEEDDDDTPVEKVQVQKQRTQKQDKKPLCKYGKNCYRKNKEHLEEYRH